MSTNKEALEIEKIHAEIVDLQQRVNESIARTTKINKENKWYPAIIASGATLAIVAVAKLFL